MSDESAETDSVRKEIERLVTSGSVGKALSTALSAAVPKDEKIKNSLTISVCSVLSSIKENEILKNVESLSEEERSNLLKFVYRGMAVGGQNCTQLLKWHAAVVDKDGVGSIMRVLSDRNL